MTEVTSELKPEELNEEIERDLSLVQLRLARAMQKKDGGDIVDHLLKHTDLLIRPSRPWAVKAAEEVLNAIRSVPFDEDWENGVLEVLKADRQKQKEAMARFNETRLMIGMFNCRIFATNDREANKLRQILGLPESMAILQLHVPIRAVEMANKRKVPGLEESLAELAVFIKEKHPEIGAVVLQSWLMSRPELVDLGFEKVPEPEDDDQNDTKYNRHSWWLQLIDKNGKVRPESLKQLEETGDMKYDDVYGKFDAVKLLEKFLPAEMRGAVTLKKINPESWQQAKKFNDEFFHLKDKYESFDAGEVEDYIRNQMPQVKEFLEQAGLFERLVALLKGGRLNGLDFRNAAKQDPGLVEQLEKMKTELNESSYEPEIVNIE